MVEMVSALINISESLSFLEEQQKEYQRIIDGASLKDHGALLKDHTLSLKLGLQFLERFLSVSSNEDIKMRIKLVVFNVRRELHSLSNRPSDGSFILDLGRVYTKLLEKTKKFFPPETRVYDVAELFRWDRDLRNFLLESIGDLPSCKFYLIAPSIKKKIPLLHALLTYVAGLRAYFLEEHKTLLAPLFALFDKALYPFYSCLVDKMDEEKMALVVKDNLSDLLEKNKVKDICIVFLKTSKVFESNDPLKSEFDLLDNLIKLLISNASSVIYLNDLSEKLDDKLKFLKTFLADLQPEVIVEKFNYLITFIEAITCAAIDIIYSCYDKDMEEGMDTDMNGALCKMIDQIEDIQAEVGEIKLYNYPQTDELGFLDLFLGHLEQLLNCRPQVIEILKNQIETLHDEFYFLRSFLRKMKEQQNEHEELCIVGLAYQAEYIIDLYLLKNAPDYRIMLSISKIIEQIKLIKLEVKRIYDEEKYHTQAYNVPKTSIHVSSKATINTTTNEVVGFEDEAEKIMEYLVGDPKQLDVVSIVGMPGLGKTTLAKKIYEAPSLIEHFDVRAWCCVSQTYQKRELLLTILGDIITIAEKMDKLNDEELAAKLYQSLKGHRYLIVIDDMWDVGAWDDLVRSLPDDKNHSRVLITSRLQNVASQTKAGSKVHPLRQFSEDESWELFHKKLFHSQSYSQELLEVGKQIAESCKRLPLAIVVIAGLLAKVEKSVHKWKQISVSLSSFIFSDSESQCKAILEQSYNHLPDHLKSCFLYFGAFPEDEEIPVWKLKWLWIAEGFVQNTGEKSLEDVAEECFIDLIGRSLVTVAKEKSDGGVKACRVHDLLYDFCLEKAKEESFMHVIHVDHWSEFLNVYDQRRLSIHSKVDDLMEAKPSSCSVRSLLHTTTKKYYLDRDVSFIFRNFKLLRVLDLACISIGEYFYGIELLIHLRYLAIAAKIAYIPSSIANLLNLQFFLVEANTYNRSKVVDVPDSLWNMENLRHVHINHRASFHVHRCRLEKASLLDNLETLSTPWFSCKEVAENLLRRLPKLKKLKCVFLDCRFPVLDFLGQLVSLKVIFEGSMHRGMRCDFNFPSNLEKLSLSKFGLLWDDISKIGRTLPNLKVLKLNGFDHDCKWIVNDGDFPKLKYLKLSNLYNIQKWIASEDSFPILEQLVLDNCFFLNEIPHRFGEIPTLQMITVKNCSRSVNDSARKIQMEQHEELQNEELKVFIYHGKPYNEDPDQTIIITKLVARILQFRRGGKAIPLGLVPTISCTLSSEDSFPIFEQLVLNYYEDLNEIPPRFEEIPTLRMIKVRACTRLCR